MPTSVMKAVPPGQHPGVGGRHVGVGAEDGGDAAVEVPAHRHLLAGHLGVEVDDDAVGLEPRRGCASTSWNGERATFSWTAPLRLITPTRIAAGLDHGVPAARVARAGSWPAGSPARSRSRNS